MSLEQQIVRNTPSLGLNLVADPMAIPEGQYTYMLNGSLYNVDGKAPFARMYKGNRKVTDLPAGFYSIGSANIAQRESCHFLVNPSTSESQIGLFDGRTYTTIASSMDLDFDITKQIQAIVDEDYNGNKTVIWVEEDKPIRYMNLNNPPMLGGVLDIDALNVFRKYSYPHAAVTEVTGNGRLLAGAYYISLQYSDENGNGLTSCTTPIGPIFIYRDSLTQAPAFINGSPDREVTDKAIRIAFSNLDQSFKYFNIVIIKSYQGIRSSVVAATLPVSQENYLYTGVPDTERDIDLKEVLTPGVSYDSAKTITLSHGTAIIGNLKGKKEFNFQPYISQIALQWQLYKEKYENASDTAANPLNSLYRMDFRRNEVYDLGIAINWKDGTKSRVYPLIARKKNYTAQGNEILNNIDPYGNPVVGGWDSGPVAMNDDIFETGGAVPERQQIFNTALLAGDDLVGDEGPHLYGEFAYWESTDTWPNDPAVWGDNAGMPIRRFKMPDHIIAPLTDGENGFRTERAVPYINRLGVRFVNIEEVMNSLPDEVKEEMAGWEFVRADRRNNKSVIGSGLIFNTFYQNWVERSLAFTFPGEPLNISQEPDDIRLYANYPLNDLNEDYLVRKRQIGTDGPWDEQAGNDRYRKDVFTFLSPDTSFNKNLLFSGELLIHKELYGVAKNSVHYLDPYPLLLDRGEDEEQSAYHNLTFGYYNNWKPSRPGTLRRQVKEAMYVPFNAQVATGAVGLPLHNLTRESTVLIAVNKDIQNPTVEDTSRSRLTDPERNCRFTSNTLYRIASAYYVSLVSRVANQYGSVFDPRYLFTNYDSSNIQNGKVIFGGDTYVAPFTAKRQLVMYQNAQTFMNLENGAYGVDLKNSQTIAGTRYYYQAIRRNAQRDSKTECEQTGELGKLPVIYTGLPVFFVESDYNIDLRINGEESWNTYYPNLKDGALRVEEWAGIKHVDKDNDYSMNLSYNEQNDLYGYQNVDPFFNPALDQQTDYSTRVIWSLPGTPENRFNNLLVYLPLNYHDFPRSDGELTDIRDIGNYRCLFRFKHAFYVESIYNGIESDQGKLVIGNGKLFQTLPQRLAKSDSGYSGSSEQWAFNNTPFGSFSTDAVRGTAFIYGKTLNDIGINDAANWLDANMPLKLLKDLPFFPHIDNPANPEGIGFHSVYDSQDKLWILTKRDYELKDKSLASHFSMQNGQLFINGGPVSLSNEKYFTDRSWTFGYSPLTQKWISWYSFKPPLYFELGKTYYSIQDGSIWAHDNPVPRTYYGKRHPFTVEVVLRTGGNQLTHTSQFMTRAFPLVNGVPQGESFTETFNKAHVYNMHQSSGEMILTVQDENDLSTILRDPVITDVSIEKFLRRHNLIWNMDMLYDLVKNPAVPFITAWPGDIIHSALDYRRDYMEAAILRDAWAKHRFTYDKEEDILLSLYLTGSLTELSYK